MPITPLMKNPNRVFNRGVVLMGTARVILLSKHGSYINARALIDRAAKTSFITKHIANILSLKIIQSNVSIRGVEGCISANSCENAQLILQSKYISDF